MPQYTLVYPTLLFSQPRLDAIPIALIDAPATLNGATVQDGFCAVFFHQQRGFIPIALCAPLARTTDTLNPITAITRIAVPFRVAPRDDASCFVPGLSTEPDQPLTLLGTTERYLLLQRPDGHTGYILQDLVSVVPQPLNPSSNSCFISGRGCLLGVFWVTLNAYVLSLCLVIATLIPLILRLILGIIIAIYVSVSAARRASSGFDRWFTLSVSLTTAGIGLGLLVILADSMR